MDVFKRTKKLIVSFGWIVLFVVMFSNMGFADPSIMLYVDGGADYYWNGEDPSSDDTITSYSTALGFDLIPTSPNGWNTDTFVTNKTAFGLVIAIDKVEWFYDMRLVAAVPEGETGTIAVNWKGGATVVGVDKGFGTPTATHGNGKPYNMPEHSVFPTNYFSYSLGDIENDGDYDPIYLDILFSGYSMVHFDAYAFNGRRWENNPCSHDVTATNPIPEPASMMLFGTGLLGLVGFGKRKFFS